MDEQTNTEDTEEIEDLEVDDASAEDIGGGLTGDDLGHLPFAKPAEKGFSWGVSRG